MSNISITVLLFPFLFIVVQSCSPCECGNWDWSDIWNGLKVSDCRDAPTLSEIPKTIDVDIEAMVITGHKLTSIGENELSRYKNLQVFWAGNNTINYIHKNAFQGLDNIRFLSLIDNAIETFPKGFLNSSLKLTKFWGYQNKLTQLENGLFTNLLLLEVINLKKNIISVVQDNCFVNLPSLEVLDLSSNFIKTLNLNLNADLQNMKSLRLNNNSWDCSDKLCGLINDVTSRKLWNDKPVPVCNNKGGRKWDQLNLQDFTPKIISNISTIEKGHDLVLQCKYCFISNVSWTMNGRKLSSIYEIEDGTSISTMTLNDIRKEEAGVYKCQIEDCTDCEEDSIFIDVSGTVSSTISDFIPVSDDDNNNYYDDTDTSASNLCSNNTIFISILELMIIAIIMKCNY